MSNTKFIATSDEETRTLLRKIGYEEIQNSNGLYTFVNDKPMTFASAAGIEISKLRYTNTLCI